MPNVAVTSRSFSRHPILRQELLDRYPDAQFNDDGLSLNGSALIKFLQGAERAITALEPLDDAIFSALPHLQVVSKYGVGVDMIDLAAMQAHGVKLGWTAGVNRHAVAELTLMMMIALLHRVPEAMADVRAGNWQQIKGRELRERTVGIVGCGHVGKLVGRYLKPYGCELLIHDLVDLADYTAETGARQVELDELLTKSNVVTLHLPLNATTREILNADRLQAMRSDAVLINAARGGLVDERVLKEMLMDHRLAGAGLDVFADEPPQDRGLIDLPSVMVTPHIGGSTEEAVLNMGRAAIRGLSDYGDPLVVAAGA